MRGTIWISIVGLFFLYFLLNDLNTKESEGNVSSNSAFLISCVSLFSFVILFNLLSSKLSPPQVETFESGKEVEEEEKQERTFVSEVEELEKPLINLEENKRNLAELQQSLQNLENLIGKEMNKKPEIEPSSTQINQVEFREPLFKPTTQFN